MKDSSTATAAAAESAAECKLAAITTKTARKGGKRKSAVEHADYVVVTTPKASHSACRATHAELPTEGRRSV